MIYSGGSTREAAAAATHVPNEAHISEAQGRCCLQLGQLVYRTLGPLRKASRLPLLRPFLPGNGRGAGAGVGRLTKHGI